jgi:aryl-alcohol dehydrogenase-like predicted oxidoreductase
MNYRRLGRSELRVSEIGVGGHHLRKDNQGGGRIFRAAAQERAAIFSRALDNGINFFDTTFKEEVISFGEALKIMGRRDEMVLCSMDEQYANFKSDNLKDYKKHTADELDCCLQWLHTDWLDVYWLRYDAGQHTDDMLRYSIEAMEEAKEAGKIRAIGNSGHSTKFMQKTMGEWNAWDVIMFPYNFAQRRAEDYVLPAAKERDVGVVIMKPFSCGRFFRIDPKLGFRDDHVLSKEKQSQIATAALKWTLQNDMVHTIVPAMNELHHVDDAVAASDSPLTSEERELLNQIADKSPSYAECYGHD